MFKPFFSIVIPTLNEEKYLPKLLKSLSKQTLRDFEVIVVDGCSKDKTVELALSYADKVVVERSNIARARNIGARMSSGKYLIFLDADTFVEPKFLEKLMKVLASSKAKCIICRPEPANLDLRGRLGYAFGWLLAKLRLSPPCYMGLIMEKEAFKKLGGFNEDLAYGEDLDLLKRASLSMKIVFPKDLFTYNDTRRWMKNGKIDFLSILKLTFMFLKCLLTGKSGPSYPIVR